MRKRLGVQAIVLMAVGALLGYVAASGKLNSFPQPSVTAAPESQAVGRPADSGTQTAFQEEC